MAFLRLCDNYIDHPKFTALSDGAFRLWHQALAFCRKHETDGLIPRTTMTHFTSYRTKRLDELRTPWKDGAAPLIELVAGFGFKVHDYLDWNLSKEEATDQRDSARLRMRRLRAGCSPRTEDRTNALVPDRVGIDPSESQFSEKKNGDAAAHFLDRYRELYAQYRHGAKLHLKPNLDWTRVCDLLATWDAARLEKLAVILLTTDDAWVSKTDRGIGVFATRASWCDDRLKAWEREHGAVSA